VNSAGQVAGYSETSDGGFAAFRWDRKTGMRQLYGPSDIVDTRAFGINSAGAVAGLYIASGGWGRAAMWDTDGVVIDLGSLGGGASYAYGINDEGSVVGFSFDALGRQRAFVWTGGMLFDLNDMVGDSDWSFTAAYAVNDRGQIAGTGYYKGVSSAFRLDPIEVFSRPALSSQEALAVRAVSAVPEPALGLPVAVGMAILFYRRKRLHLP
jgi:probable HAF family extracellular repeat protein